MEFAGHHSCIHLRDLRIKKRVVLCKQNALNELKFHDTVEDAVIAVD